MIFLRALKIVLIAPLFSLFVWVGVLGAATNYYVSSSGSGSTCSEVSPCAIAGIPWETIETDLKTQDVHVKFKRGDTFGQLSVLDWKTYTKDDSYRLYIEDYGSGKKPKFQVNSSKWYYVIRQYRLPNVTYKNLEIRNRYESGPTPGQGLYFDDAGKGGNNYLGGIHVINCDFYWHGHYAIAFTRMGDYNIVEGCTFNYCGNGAYWINETGTSGSDYNYAANNTCAHINWTTDANYNAKYDGHCIVFQSGSYNVTENNTARYTRFPFQVFTFGTEVSIGNIFRNNKVVDAYYSGIDLYDDSTAGSPGYGSKIYNNIINDAAQYPSGTPRPALRVARTNGSGWTYIFNNTVYDSDNRGVQIKDGVDYTKWWNNIVWTDGLNTTTNLLTSMEKGSAPGSNYDVDYNLYWTGGGDPSSTKLWLDYDGSAHNWATWRRKAGHDTNSPPPANPNFLNTTNFALKAGSAAIDNGGWLSAVTQATGSGKQFTVSDGGWFHGRYGKMVDADGNAVTGSPVSLYDVRNGLQYATVIAVSGNTITVDTSVNWTQNVTKIAVGTVYGTAPDIGAYEYK